MSNKRVRGRTLKILGAAFLLAGGLGSAIPLSHSQVALADADSMSHAPGGTSTSGTEMPGKNVFAPKVMPGITKTWAFGSTADWSIDQHGDYCLHYTKPGSIADKGKMGVFYQNVGIYQGHIVDVRITITDYKYNNNLDKLDHIDNNDRTTLEMGSKDVSVTFPFSNPGSSVKLKIDYLDDKTRQPLNLDGQYSFNDIDPNQGMWLDPTTTSRMTHLYYTPDTKLYYENIGGEALIYNRHFRAYPADHSETDEDPEHGGWLPDGTPNPSYINHDETWLPHNFSIAYEGASTMGITWGNSYGGEQNEARNARDWPGQDFRMEAIANAFWRNPAYSSELSSKVIGQHPEDDVKTITTETYSHDGGAFLELGAKAVLREKPQPPHKYVSDSDEGTDKVDEVGLINKSVDHNILKNRYETYHYQITHMVPDVQSVFRYQTYEITDKLDKILDYSNVHVYNNENQDVTYRFTVEHGDDNTLKVTAKPSSLQQGDFYHETYKILFDAKIKPGVSLADHKDPEHPDQARILNTPKVTIDNESKDGNTTKTNVPFTHPAPTKEVSKDGTGNGTQLNVDFDKEYKYRVDATAPDNVNMTSYEIDDQIEKVQNIKDVKVYDYDDKDSAGNPKDISHQGHLTLTDNKVVWKADDASKWHGKHIKMFITATVKNTPDLLKYLDRSTGKIMIPNMAHLKFNDKDQTTNTTHVTPNSPKASVTKKIEVTDDNTGQQIGSGDLSKGDNHTNSNNPVPDQNPNNSSKGSDTTKSSTNSGTISLFGNLINMFAKMFK